MDSSLGVRWGQALTIGAALAVCAACTGGVDPDPTPSTPSSTRATTPATDPTYCAAAARIVTVTQNEQLINCAGIVFPAPSHVNLKVGERATLVAEMPLDLSA